MCSHRRQCKHRSLTKGIGRSNRLIKITRFDDRRIPAYQFIKHRLDITFDKRYGIVTNLYADARSTDDTEFGVLTAKALLDSGGMLTPESTAATWRKYVLDRGGAKKRAGRPLYGALANLARGIEPPLSGRHNIMNVDDGAAMRASPHGILRAGDPEGAAKLAAIDACVSHDMDGIWAAEAIAASVAVAMADGMVEEILGALGSGAALVLRDEAWLGGARAFWGRCAARMWTPPRVRSGWLAT